MMSSQLGRIVLDASHGSGDEMSVKPDADGGYGPIDAVIGEIASRVGAEQVEGSERRPGNVSMTD